MSSLTAVPGYLAGTWSIDPLNSEVGFRVRHLGVSRVYGRFNEVAGDIVTGATIEESSVSATIAAGSIDIGYPDRDAFIKGDDVLAAATHSELRFVSTSVRAVGDGYLVDGELTVRGVTRPVTLAAEIGGFGAHPQAGHRVVGVSATTTITRADFGFAAKVPAAIVGEKIEIRLDVQARLRG
jgi:polyisoprenoid-binding protein YceI